MDPEEDNYIDEPFANYEEDFEQITDSTLQQRPQPEKAKNLSTFDF